MIFTSLISCNGNTTASLITPPPRLLFCRDELRFYRRTSADTAMPHNVRDLTLFIEFTLSPLMLARRASFTDFICAADAASSSMSRVTFGLHVAASLSMLIYTDIIGTAAKFDILSLSYMTLFYFTARPAAFSSPDARRFLIY